MSRPPLHLFEAFGVELEYMIVDRESLAVKPIADQLMRAAVGEEAIEATFGPIGWSNELVLHVVELKTANPEPSLEVLPEWFAENVAAVERLLEPLGARLLPSGAHPLMDPARETRLWPHENNEIYRAYDRIFGCRGHGWSNLQSAHLNLPFADDAEFAKLHTAIRLVLPLIPGLAASTPLYDGVATGVLDRRLEVYQRNQARVPLITGLVVPEAVTSRAAYHERILEPIWAAIAPLDPDGILQYEWLNSRGAIGRFERGSIEIRIVDLQECPLADVAILAAIVAVVRAIASERWLALDEQLELATERLAAVYQRAVRDADAAVVDEPELLRAFSLESSRSLTIGEIWSTLIAELIPESSRFRAILDEIVGLGPLARRRFRAIGEPLRHERIREVYRELAACLDDQRLFRP
ncbi:MAG: glutamate--cysteine ligase [Myxococcales bacterium]|nr:glutamate--cysteine ligase [Myxococcales bacterium]